MEYMEECSYHRRQVEEQPTLRQLTSLRNNKMPDVDTEIEIANLSRGEIGVED